MNCNILCLKIILEFCITQKKSNFHLININDKIIILIVGGGQMASDIVSEWYNLTDCIYWSILCGQHFFCKYAKILPWDEPQPLDKSSSRALTTIAPYHKSKPGLG